MSQISNPFTVVTSPQPMAKRIKPNIYFQLGTAFTYVNHKLFEKDIFDYDVSIPYLSWFMHTAPTDPESKGKEHADMVLEAYNSWKQARPGREFKWAFWPGGFGYGCPEAGLSMAFNDPEDKVNTPNGPVSGVFSAKGRTKQRNWSIRFFHTFKAWLTIYGLPDPVYIDPDYEGPQGSLIIDPTSPSNSLALYKADPRYSSELIDGQRTLEQIVNSATDITGKLIPAAQMFPAQFGAGVEHTLVAGLHSSISFMTVDFYLSDTLYKPAKAVFPNVKCGNYNVYPASPTHPTYVYRPKETPYLFNTSMKADVGVLSEYGTNVWENNVSNPNGDWGYRTRDEMIKRYGINPAKYANQSDLYKALWLADFNANASHLVKSAGKEGAIWLSWEQACLFHNINLNADQWPPNGVQLAYDKNLVYSQLQIASKNGIKHIGIFDSDDFVSGLSDATINIMLTFWADILANLGNLGYQPAVRTPRTV